MDRSTPELKNTPTTIKSQMRSDLSRENTERGGRGRGALGGGGDEERSNLFTQKRKAVNMKIIREVQHGAEARVQGSAASFLSCFLR